MAQRGRKAAAAIAVASQVVPEVSANRLPAPVHLTDAEQVVWLRVVNDQPAGAFTPVHQDILEMYCRHVVQAQVLAEELEAFDRKWLCDDYWLKRYDKLLAMRDREVRSASSLATRLRITRQATSDPKTVGRASRNMSRSRKPWELTLDDEG